MSRDDEDPFASISKLCHISSSQELLFPNRPFARQFEAFSDDSSPENNEAPVESTGIFMVSPPDDDDSPHDVFKTPPEESLPVSSDKQRIAAVDDNADRGIDHGTVVVDDPFTDGERTVDLGKDSDLGFSEVKSIDRSVRVSERGSPRKKVVGESPAKRLKLCEENFENCHKNEEILVVTKRVVCCNGSTEVVQSECEENREVLGFGEEMGRENSVVRDGGEVVENGGNNEDIRKGHELQSNGEGGSVSRSIEDLEKFRYVGTSHPNSGKILSKTNRGQRALPLSIDGRAENSVGEEEELVAGISASANPNAVGGGESVADVSSLANPLWRSIRDVLKVLAESCEPDPPAPRLENADLLDIAKSCGMTFPRLS